MAGDHYSWGTIIGMTAYTAWKSAIIVVVGSILLIAEVVVIGILFAAAIPVLFCRKVKAAAGAA
jgi:hypothetical protein